MRLERGTGRLMSTVGSRESMLHTFKTFWTGKRFLKLFIFAALIVRLALPVATGTVWLDWPIFALGMLVVAVVIGVVESTMARLRLTHVPILLVAACLLGAFGFILLMR